MCLNDISPFPSGLCWFVPVIVKVAKGAEWSRRPLSRFISSDIVFEYFLPYRFHLPSHLFCLMYYLLVILKLENLPSFVIKGPGTLKQSTIL